MDIADSAQVEFCPTEAQAATSRLAEFIRYSETEVGQHFADWQSFEQFAIENFRIFWELLLRWSKLPLSGSLQPACIGADCEHAQFFPDVQLNYAEVLLNGGASHNAAIVACHKDRPPDRISFGELRRKVERLAATLQTAQIQPGDRVVAVARNNLEIVTAALASAAVGAVFSSCSHDMGSFAVLSRFRPLKPKVLLANVRTEVWDSFQLAERVLDVIRDLPTLTTVVSLDDCPLEDSRCVTLTQCLQTDVPFVWRRFPFNHPLFVLFSSGTTGAPKCIVHGAGGTVLEHFKEQVLHCDLKRGDKLFFQTACGWMMWNWQLTALSSGAELVLYDGPLDGPETLWKIVDEQRVTVFGTNPAYLQFCQDSRFRPGDLFQLGALRAMLSTGSIYIPGSSTGCTRVSSGCRYNRSPEAPT